MSWNNAYETKKFNKEQAELEAYYRVSGMTEAQIRAIQAYDKREFLDKRSKLRNGEEVSMYDYDANGNEILVVPEDAVVDEVLTDPFVYGFEDDRLNRIWSSLTDEIDRTIFVLLSEGMSQEEIGEQINMSQRGVGKRIKKLRETIRS